MGSPSPFVSSLVLQEQGLPSALCWGMWWMSALVVRGQRWQLADPKSSRGIELVVRVVESLAYRGTRPCWPSAHRRVGRVV